MTDTLTKTEAIGKLQHLQKTLMQDNGLQFFEYVRR